MTENKKSLNQKIADLDSKVEWFYSDDFNLDEAVAKYKESIKIAKEVQRDLSELFCP